MSRSRRLRLITLNETLIILDITKTESNNCFIIHSTKKKMVLVFIYFVDVLPGQRSKPRSHTSRTANNTKRANLTWLPLEIMHCGHTWHDYPWPWHDIKFWRHGLWFRKFTVGFRPIKKELESWMYNNQNYLHACVSPLSMLVPVHEECSLDNVFFQLQVLATNSHSPWMWCIPGHLSLLCCSFGRRRWLC